MNITIATHSAITRIFSIPITLQKTTDFSDGKIARGCVRRPWRRQGEREAGRESRKFFGDGKYRRPGVAICHFSFFFYFTTW